jgi:predicted Zn-ribbon and HTH transcriptional regulator
MLKCEKCGVEVPHDEIYEDSGQKICEDCKIEGIQHPDIHPYFTRIKKSDEKEV